jgi:class 3 adenylate cyclase
MHWNAALHKLERLAVDRMVVRFDPRGSGLSDRGVGDYTLQARVSDLEAVVDRLGLDRFAIDAVRNMGLVALAFAAANPDRVTRIVLEDGFAAGTEFWGTPTNRGLVALAEYVWETFTETNARTVVGWDHTRTVFGKVNAGDAAARLAAYTRACSTQADFLALATAEIAIDLRPRLAEVTMPVMVARSGMRAGSEDDAARRLATLLPAGTFVALSSGTHYADAIDAFLGEDNPRAAAPAVEHTGLRTILFTDVEGHTALMQRLGDERGRELLREHERLTREALAANGGTEVKALGDGFMASFTSAQRALECAIAIQRALSAAGDGDMPSLRVRIGINAGEPIAEDDDLFGASVILAARIAAQAQGGEVLVSDVVRQLAHGKSFRFGFAGERALRGFDDPVRLWELEWREP